MAASPVRIGLRGVSASATEAELAALRRRLSEVHAVRLRDVLQDDLLDVVWRKLESAPFREYVEPGDHRQEPVDGSINAFLAVLMTDRKLFELVESVSGCRKIRRVTGGVYRMQPGRKHHVCWHGDIGRARRVMTMTFNLGRRPVEGGLFQIKRAGESRILQEFPYERSGDAILFRLAPELRHRSTVVEGKVPKTIFTCWFHA